jgi:hypothetical protein
MKTPGDPSRPTRGPVLFAADASPAYRRRRLAVAVVLGVAFLAVQWPAYRLFSGVFPLILGLPLSLAWVVLWIGVVFVALTWLYCHEPKEEGEENLKA